MLSVAFVIIMLSVVMLNVVVMNVIMLSIVMPWKGMSENMNIYSFFACPGPML